MNHLRPLARVAVASALISTLGTQPLWAWGSDGHMMINRLAAQYLPDTVPAFVRDAVGQQTIEYLGPEPDRWRSLNEPELSAAQAPDHFIDIEWAELAAPPCPAATTPGCVDGVLFPRKRADFVHDLDVAQPAHPDITLTPDKVGMQPWQVEEVYERLKADFREYRNLVAHKPDPYTGKPLASYDLHGVQTAILFDAGWLGHYVGDGSMPLHISIQYNGWVGPNPNGYTTEHKIHAQFESIYVAANVKRSDLDPLVAAAKPTLIDDEWTQYLDYISHTHTFVEKTYQLEKAGAFTGAGTPEGKTFTDERIAAGAIELRDLIYSAWVHSAEPEKTYHAH